jgi:hypothetical protein
VLSDDDLLGHGKIYGLRGALPGRAGEGVEMQAWSSGSERI